MLQEALKSKLRVGINPDMGPDHRHGSVWFDVSGFGRVRRDFVVDYPDILANDMLAHANQIARQIMLIDPTLPKKETNCCPVKIDIVVDGFRRIFEYGTLRILFEQQL